MKYNKNIDVMKGIAIIFVILIHSFNDETLHKIGGPFYLLQAVPLFLIISGYNQAQSYNRHSIKSLAEFYHPTFLLKKLYRLLPIALIIYALQALFGPEEHSFLFYLIGRGGYGGYYISIMIQAILVLPLLYLLVEKTSPLTMLLLSFVGNLMYEYFCYSFDIPSFLYRLLLFRYLFALALGMWYFFDSHRTYAAVLMKIGAVFSVWYLLVVHYFDIPVPFYSFDTSWKGQDPLSFFYSLLVFYLGLKYFSSFRIDIIKQSFIFLGKRSYAIFIVQMLYFWLLSAYTDWPESLFLLDVLVSCSLGTALYRIEQRYVSGKIKNLFCL
ncbi:hypothetical protein JTF06_12615 [Desemzia sp. RIT804]|uniref:acyltransferase family protein n=1 Tax=Desemzia sp. RIT 804 TaxID=2810209 RepID=UPI00194F4FBB|nr:acyltransferase family protein [Desemzia sp. RIT 804]MBM6615727.1 hypothetical protein [Desemzia sp. RIT 804]